ncbi:MAG: D-alanyl-D-alanine carboxypeptidase family protein [Clostridia bacterium]
MIIVTLNGAFINLCYADDVEEDETEEITETEINEVNEVSKNAAEVPILNSRRCVIFDRTSKTVMYGKNEELRSAMASTTKIMTATIALENGNLQDEITIDRKAAGTGGSRLGLKRGDKITLNDLLYGLMLRSGNDAAVAIAEHIGGSVEGFAELMNQKATELGLKDTHFVTPHGLDSSEHYTTALELAKLTDYALKNEKFAKIVATKSTTISINGNPRQLSNTNELLGVLNGVIGVKTGFTNGAGRCLVTETKRGDMDIIVVVLGADTKKDRTKDSIKLIEYAFSNFTKVNIKEKAIEEFEKWGRINKKRILIIKGQKDTISLDIGKINTEAIPVKETDKLEITINTINQLEAPVEKNTKVGTIIIKLNDNIIDSIDIVCGEKIERKTWLDYFKENLQICRTIFEI